MTIGRDYLTKRVTGKHTVTLMYQQLNSNVPMCNRCASAYVKESNSMSTALYPKILTQTLHFFSNFSLLKYNAFLLHRLHRRAKTSAYYTDCGAKLQQKCGVKVWSRIFGYAACNVT